MSDGTEYDADYFLRGKQTGKSLYSDYRWLPDLTVPMAASIIRHLRIEPTDTILDFGCARGYTVRAFREMGYDAWGVDASEWAIANCDPAVKNYVFLPGDALGCPDMVDWVVAKDVLEHVEDLCQVIDALMASARKGVFAVVPLSYDGKKYDVPEYEADVTHLHRRPLQWWVGHFHRPGWSVEGRYRVRGVKDNYAHHPTGNGFITARIIGG